MDDLLDRIVIRRARPGDGEACARLWTDFGRTLASRMPGFREPDQEGLAEWFEAGIAATGDALRAVAELDGELVALVHAKMRMPEGPPGPSLNAEAQTPRAVIEDIVVTDGFRSRGIGDALVRYVEEWARGNGATAVMLNSDPDGPVRRFYERCGYDIVAALYVKRL